MQVKLLIFSGFPLCKSRSDVSSGSISLPWDRNSQIWAFSTLNWIYTYIISRTEKRELHCLCMTRNVTGCSWIFIHRQGKKTHWKKSNRQLETNQQKRCFIIASLQLLFSNVTGPFVNSFHNWANFVCSPSTLREREESDEILVH